MVGKFQSVCYVRERIPNFKICQNKNKSIIYRLLYCGCVSIFHPFSVVGFAVSIALGVFVCHVFRISDHIKTTSITISVVVIIPAVVKDICPIENAGLRFAESVIGSLVTVTVGYIAMIVFKLGKSGYNK